MLNISQSAGNFNFILLVPELIQPVCNFQSGEPKLYEHTGVGMPQIMHSCQIRITDRKPRMPILQGFPRFLYACWIYFFDGVLFMR